MCCINVYTFSSTIKNPYFLEDTFLFKADKVRNCVIYLMIPRIEAGKPQRSKSENKSLNDNESAIK